MTDLHSNLLLWMVQLMLTSSNTTWTPSRAQGEGERAEVGIGEEMMAELGREGDGWNHGMGLTALLSVDVTEEYDSLSSSLKRLTTALTR